MGKTVGCVLLAGGGLFAILGLSAANAYSPLISAQLYFAAAFSCLVFGTICFELGKCAEYLSKMSKKDNQGQQQGGDNTCQSNENFVRCGNCGKPMLEDEEKCPHCLWVAEK